MRTFRFRSLFAAAILLGSSAAFAQDAKQEFDKLFGAEVKRVSATADPADDVELAQQLLNAAKGSIDKPEMRDHLCENAFALANRDAAGYPIAIEAMQLIADNNPAKKTECEAKILAVYQRGYDRATGDKKIAAGQAYVDHLNKLADVKIAAKDYTETLNILRRARPVAIAIKSDSKDSIQAKIDTYTQLSMVTTKVDVAEKKIKANPWDKAAHASLVELYLTDMDDPAKAYKHLELGGDDAQKKFVPLAMKPMSEIDEPTALALADFYESQSKKGITLTKIAMLTRAKAYHEHYATLHTTEDVQKAAAALSAKRVTDTLAKLEAEMGPRPAVAAAGDKSIDLLDYVDPSRDRVRGNWYRVGETIRAERGGFTDIPILRAPVRIDSSNYTLKIKAIRDSGEGSIGIIFPVGESQVSYSINLFPSGAAGLSNVAGQDASRNDTRKDVAVTNGKVFNVDIIVKTEDDGGAAIAIAFDGKSVLDWKGKQSDLSLSEFVRIGGDTKTVAFMAFNSAVTIGSAKVKAITGKAEPTEKAVDKSVKDKSLKDEKAKPAAPRDDERRDREKMIEDFVKDRFKGGFPKGGR